MVLVYGYTASSFSVVANTWYHLSLVREGDTVSLFINGLMKATATDSSLGTVTTSTGDNTYIGQSHFGSPSQFYYAGLIDDVIFFRQAKTPSNLAAIYTNGRGFSTTTNLTLSLPSSVLVGNNIAASVTRSGQTISSITITLSSDDAVATVPASVTIPARFSAATFAVDGVSAGSATISVTATGATSDSDTITVAAGGDGGGYNKGLRRGLLKL